MYIYRVHRFTCHLKNYHSISFKIILKEKKWKKEGPSVDLKDNNGVDDGCWRQKEIFLQPPFCIFVLLIYQIRCSHVPRGMIKKKKVDLSEEIVSLFFLSHSLYSLLKVFIVSDSKKWLQKTCLFRRRKYETIRVRI